MLFGGLAAAALVALFLVQRVVRGGGDETRDTTALAPSPAVAVPPPAPVAPAVDSAAIDTVSPGLSEPDTLTSPPAAALAPVPAAPAVNTPAAPPSVPLNVRWSRAVAETYINVRSGPDRKAPVVGVVTPSMRVELGASVRGWRQVRAPGVNGWADPRNFKDDPSASPR